jgi:hypothetical protein
MKPAIAITALLSGLAVQSAAQAGGYFQRVPEVGEWAQYEMTFTEARKFEGDEDFSESPELAITLTLKCVGEEVVDGERCLWIEDRLDVTPPEDAGPDAEPRGFIIKMLVPEDHIVGSDLYDHFVWGQWQGQEGVSIPLEHDVTTFGGDTPWTPILIALCATQDAAERSESITVTLDGTELEFDTAISGAFRDRELEDATLTGEADWWTSEDHAFGVVASRINWLQTPTGEGHVARVTAEARLTATGTDATSDLPDVNCSFSP